MRAIDNLVATSVDTKALAIALDVQFERNCEAIHEANVQPVTACILSWRPCSVAWLSCFPKGGLELAVYGGRASHHLITNLTRASTTTKLTSIPT